MPEFQHALPMMAFVSRRVPSIPVGVPFLVDR